MTRKTTSRYQCDWPRCDQTRGVFSEREDRDQFPDGSGRYLCEEHAAITCFLQTTSTPPDDIWPSNLNYVPSPKPEGPTPGWVKIYKEVTGYGDPVTGGKMNIAPEPTFAWACERVLGGYDPATVFDAIRANDNRWPRVLELYQSLKDEVTP